MRKLFLALLGLVVFSSATTPSAHADTTVGTPISKVPFNIKKPGKYRLIKNLTMNENLTVSAAITVSAPGVVLDLNGFTITGPATSPTSLSGIAANADRVTIRNGTVSGFLRAITTSSYALLEDMNIHEPAQTGFAVGDDSTVRRCNVTMGYNSTATTLFTYAGSVGQGCDVSDCIVRIQGAPGRLMYGLGIGPRSVARNCTAIGLTPDPSTTALGIYRNFGTEPSRIEGCTVFGFNIGFDGIAFSYDRCHASECTSALKGSGISVTGNNF